MTKKIGIIFAMQKELELFSGILKDLQIIKINHLNFYCGELCGKNVVSTICGMGKVNAALGTASLINKFAPDILLNIGVSGGLDDTLKIGDVVAADTIVYHDVWCGEEYEYGQVQGLPPKFLPTKNLLEKLQNYKKGMFCCGDKFITSATELQTIKEKFPKAVAVDMESAAIAQTCYFYQMPFLCVRQISDIPGTDHNIKQYEKFWQNAPDNSMKILQDILQKV